MLWQGERSYDGRRLSSLQDQRQMGRGANRRCVVVVPVDINENVRTMIQRCMERSVSFLLWVLFTRLG